MRIISVKAAAAIFLVGFTAQGQIKRTSVPLGDALDKAIDKSSILAGEVRPFHIRMVINEPENPQSPYQ